MNELQSLSSQLTKLKEAGQNKIPVSLKEEIVRAIETSRLSLDEAVNIFKIHPMTFYKWRRKLMNNTVSANTVTVRTVTTKKNKKYKKRKIIQKKDNFIELLPPAIPPSISILPKNTSKQLFLEIELGHGNSLRIYR